MTRLSLIALLILCVVLLWPRNDPQPPSDNLEISVEWRGKPVFIRWRTEEELDAGEGFEE